MMINQAVVRPSTVEATADLQAKIKDIDGLTARLEAGEPVLPSSLRGSVGRFLKARLYRLLWWQSQQIRGLAELVGQWARSELEAINSLAEAVNDLERVNSDSRLRQLESSVGEQDRNSKAAEQRLQAEIAEREDVTRRLSHFDERLRAEIAEREKLGFRVSELGVLAHQNRLGSTIQERRLTQLIEEARRRLPEPFTADQVQTIVKHGTDHKYDGLYLMFEDVFRGTRDDIKKRQSVYLPLLKEKEIGSPSMPVLDLGCGRGEWLEVLRENGIEANGIDNNDLMIEQCRQLGFDVSQGDALSHMRQLPNTCMGAITSFHMVEHFPFEMTLALIDEAHRVLKPGGLLILETPNPRNVLVSTYTFYFDPTHMKPLPSPMLQFFVEARGFCDAKTLELHPYPKPVHVEEDEHGIADRFNEYFYGPQDYAVIGSKP
jgi:O-antigen chain-terminating methyltransferase